MEEFTGLKPKIYSFLADDSSEHEKAKCVNKSIDATITHGECKDVLWKNKCLGHLMNRIRNKNRKIGTCEINKVSLL